MNIRDAERDLFCNFFFNWKKKKNSIRVDFSLIDLSAKLEKLTTAVREAGVSRHDGLKLRAPPLNPPNIILLWLYEEISGGPSIDPHDAEGRQSLGHLNASSLLFFPSDLFLFIFLFLFLTCYLTHFQFDLHVFFLDFIR